MLKEEEGTVQTANSRMSEGYVELNHNHSENYQQENGAFCPADYEHLKSFCKVWRDKRNQKKIVGFVAKIKE